MIISEIVNQSAVKTLSPFKLSSFIELPPTLLHLNLKYCEIIQKNVTLNSVQFFEKSELNWLVYIKEN